MRAFNLLIKYLVHNIVSWVEQEDSQASGGGAVSAVLWLAHAGLSLVRVPQLGLWLADCRDQAGSSTIPPCHVAWTLAWCKHWSHVTHVSGPGTRVWENANQDVCPHVSHYYQVWPRPCQRDKICQEELPGFVCVSELRPGRATATRGELAQSRARDSESISTQLSFPSHEKQREEVFLVQVWGERGSDGWHQINKSWMHFMNIYTLFVSLTISSTLKFT